MSSENKIPLNLYGIMDNELQRMHTLLNTFLTLPNQVNQNNGYSSYGSSTSEIYKRIVTMQDLLLQSVISHDRELQERIAELALMDKQSESKSLV